LEHYRLDVDLDPDEIKARQKHSRRLPSRANSGYLARYAALVGSADEGAILKACVLDNQGET
jgi:dihydroxyacid dehydratase/phosphogluconate dehydratase